jgi:hypothetical protein
MSFIIADRACQNQLEDNKVFEKLEEDMQSAAYCLGQLLNQKLDLYIVEVDERGMVKRTISRENLKQSLMYQAGVLAGMITPRTMLPQIRGSR